MLTTGDSIQPVFVESKAAWRRWLRVHHASESEVWLTIRRKGSGKPGVFMGDAIDEALCFGWIDGKMYSRTSDYFILRFTPRKPNSIWSEANKKRILALMKEGRMHAAGLALVHAAKKSGHGVLRIR